jgi:Zn ribbon nucleic-acid-binding protein
MEAFVDSDNKIITSCPNCDSQDALYLVKGNQIISGYQTIHCGECQTPYVVDVQSELKINIEVFSCKKES